MNVSEMTLEQVEQASAAIENLEKSEENDAKLTALAARAAEIFDEALAAKKAQSVQNDVVTGATNEEKENALNISVNTNNVGSAAVSASVAITKENVLAPRSAEKFLAELSLAELRQHMVVVTDSGTGEESEMVALFGNIAIERLNDPEGRYCDFYGDYEDAKRIARGVALQIAGAVQPDGAIKTDGSSIYVVDERGCQEMKEGKPIVGFDGKVARKTQMSACKGRIVSKKVNGEFVPVVRTNESGERYVVMANLCKHQAASTARERFFALPKKYMESMLAAMATEVGDAEAREWAEAYYAEKGEAYEQRQMASAFYKVAKNNAINNGRVTQSGRVAPTPQVLDLPFYKMAENGELVDTGLTIADAVATEARGHIFWLRVAHPLIDAATGEYIGKTNMNGFIAGCNNVKDLADKAAVMYEAYGNQMKVYEVHQTGVAAQ